MAGKPIAVFDIDGTIFRSSLFVEVTNALVAANIFPPEVKAAYAQAYENWLNRDGSYEDYLNSMIKAFHFHLNGIKSNALDEMSATVVNNMSRRTYRYTRDLIDSLKPTHFLAAISGSPKELVAPFCKIYGFGDFRATEYEVKDGLYTGKANLGNKDKDVAVRDMVKKHNLTFDGSIGVGDSESDAAFLGIVDQPIAFNPNSMLFAEATKQGWQVVVERKDVIYHYNQ